MPVLSLPLGHSALRRLCSSARQGGRLLTTIQKPVSLLSAATTRPVPSASFSVMSATRGSAPMTFAPRNYDPEITNIASYVHQYTVQSDLAVSPQKLELRVC